MDSLADKLKSLGVRTGLPSRQTSPEKKARYDISEVVAGRDVQTAFGPSFLIETRYSADNLPAGWDSIPTDLSVLAKWSGLADLPSRSPEEILFLDTETSGLAGGTGTFAFLVGLGRWSPSGFELAQLFMRDPAQEPALLASLVESIGPAKIMVTFNGKGFDLPILNTRHVLNGISSPFPELGHIDLLPLARRLWRNRLASRALKDLETEILGLGRTQEEVPGWMIPEIYYEYLHSGDARPLNGVIYHNAQDILSLGLLFNHVAALLAEPLRVSAGQGLDLIAIARLYEDLGDWEGAVGLYEHSLGEGLPLPFFLDTLRRYANLHRKQERWEDARLLWEKAASYHQVDACIELAKHHEHRERDYRSAIHWVEIGLAYLAEIPPSPLRNEFQSDLSHRADRIRAKLGR